MNSTQKALQRFVKNTLAEARFQAAFGDRRMARLLRAGVSDVIAETRAAMPTTAPVVPMSPWLAKRREQGRAYAIALSQLMGQPPRPARPRS